MRAREPNVNSDVRAGVFVGTHGLAGDLKLDASRIGLDAVRSGLRATAVLPDGEERAIELRAVRFHKGRPLVCVRGYETATTAEALVGATLMIARADAPLSEGEYYDDDLIGCRLIDSDGVERGMVVDVGHYPAQDILFVGPTRAMVPLVSALIRKVDVVAKCIDVDIPSGLLDPENATEA